MTRNKTLTKLEKFRNSALYCAVMSTFAGFGVVVLCILIFSLLITRFDAPDSFVTVLACLALCIGAYTSGLICAKKKRKNGLFFGLCCGGIMFLFVMILGAIFAKVAITQHFTSKLLMTIICACFGGIIGVNSRRKKY